MSDIKKEDIQHVAKLARISIEDVELSRYADELIKIIEYVDMLNQVDTDDIEPTYSVCQNINRYRPDEPEPSCSREEILNNAPRRDLVNIRTKGVFNE